MARSRSLPSQLFWVPTFSDLSSETQIILIGLTLIADDEGRGPAQTRFLVRQFDKDASQIEGALEELINAGFLQCYRVGNERYYQHLYWQEWETLSKPTPSRYPAPPSPSSPGPTDGASPRFQRAQENPGKPWETPSEGEGEGEEKRKKEQEENGEEEQEGTTSSIVTFPGPTRIDSSHSPFQHDFVERTTQIAHILRLDVSPALTRLMEEYLSDPTLSVLSEADAAREWIDTPRRNSKQQPMTLAFFRRWLKREREEILTRQSQRQPVQVTGTPGSIGDGAISSSPSPVSAPNPYQDYLERRQRELGLLPEEQMVQEACS